jgi:hypothetical protein
MNVSEKKPTTATQPKSGELTSPPSAKMHPAEAAGLSRNEFFKTDRWIVDNAIHTTPTHTVPHSLASVFVLSSNKAVASKDGIYDRSKFTVNRYMTDKEPLVFARVYSHQTKEDVAEVTMHNDTFVVELFKPKKGVFPFNKEDFLSAVNGAKWNVELDLLGDENK